MWKVPSSKFADAPCYYRAMNLDELKPTGIPAIDKAIDKAKAEMKQTDKVMRKHEKNISGIAVILKNIKKPKA